MLHKNTNNWRTFSIWFISNNRKVIWYKWHTYILKCLSCWTITHPKGTRSILNRYCYCQNKRRIHCVWEEINWRKIIWYNDIDKRYIMECLLCWKKTEMQSSVMDKKTCPCVWKLLAPSRVWEIINNRKIISKIIVNGNKQRYTKYTAKCLGCWLEVTSQYGSLKIKWCKYCANKAKRKFNPWDIIWWRKLLSRIWGIYNYECIYCWNHAWYWWLPKSVCSCRKEKTNYIKELLNKF